jgi:CheY-like chemotaxis protein
MNVAFMDCQMQEQDGLEATAAIRHAERGLGTHTPIIAMTATASAAFARGWIATWRSR